VKCWNRNLSKTYNIGKTGLALHPGRLRHRSVVNMMLPAESMLRQHTELVPVTTNGLPERKGEGLRG